MTLPLSFYILGFFYSFILSTICFCLSLFASLPSIVFYHPLCSLNWHHHTFCGNPKESSLYKRVYKKLGTLGYKYKPAQTKLIKSSIRCSIYTALQMFPSIRISSLCETEMTEGGDGQIYLQCIIWISVKGNFSFPSKNDFDEPLSMTAVCGYMEERESHTMTNYLLSLPGGESRR